MFSGLPSNVAIGVTATMKSLHCRLFQALLPVLAFGAAALSAGTAISSTRIQTDPAGASFYVDGQRFTGSATFLWPQGSQHTLNIDVEQWDSTVRERYIFQDWTTSAGLSMGAAPLQIISADPSITSYKAAMKLQYAVSLSFFACQSCNSPGTIYVNNIPYTTDAEVYFDAGAAIALSAVPNAGYVFAGWQGPFAQNQASLISFNLTAPFIVYAKFLPGLAVTVASDPPGLQVLADRTQVYSPVALEWGYGTSHTIGAVTPQTDLHGRRWVFSSWSDGGAATHTYNVASNQTSALTLTARYAPGGQVTLATNPPGLNLIVDGVNVAPPYNFIWGAGTPHTISAPQQVDASGHGWVFKSWSNGGAASQIVTLGAADVAAGFRLTASFSPSSQTTGTIAIQSSPAGVDVLVDGSDCVTPCTVERTIGSHVYVSAPASVQWSGDSRLEWTAWADGGPPDRAIAVAPGTQTLSANYQTYFRLGCAANPASAVTWHFSPAYADGFYAAKTAVTVSIDVAAGYSLAQWEGDASGAARSITVTLDQPRNIRARLKRTANDGIDNITNAAGETPEAAVAPGSLIAIYGPKLALGAATGPASPLAQTLAGVTVTIGDQLLPLLFASPAQINAQLPSELAEGDYTLTVHSEGQRDATGVITVARNAPGLFAQQILGRPYLIALHADGSLVTLKSPARRGELVTALGTGFGPYQPQPPDGFAVPVSPAYPLADPAELVFQDRIVLPEFVGAAPGRVGVTALKFRIADPLPTASTIEIKARVNGHESNTVLLPLE